MKINKSFSLGFSLAEMLVVLSILVIFAAAAAPIMTKKYKKDSYSAPRGQFECYKKGATTYKRTTIKGTIGPETVVAGSSCTFTPTKDVMYYLINIVGGGGGGATNSGAIRGGGAAGEFKSVFYPELTQTVTMTPGVGGTGGSTTEAGVGGDSSFYLGSASTKTTVAKGGKGGFYNHSNILKYTTACKVGTSSYSSYCNGTTKISSCSNYTANPTYMYVDNCYYTFYTLMTYNTSTLKWTTNSYAVNELNLTFSVPDWSLTNNTGQVSKFSDYIATGNYNTDGNTTVAKLGNGGAVGTAGSSGAIMILW